MIKYKTLYEIVYIVLNFGISIQFENRLKLGYRTYDNPNHAEILKYMNRADNMLWDAQVFGYKHQFPFDKIFKTKKVLGVIWIPDGNHKIVLKLSNKGFSKRLFYKQLNTYLYNYRKSNDMHNVKFIPFH